MLFPNRQLFLRPQFRPHRKLPSSGRPVRNICRSSRKVLVFWPDFNEIWILQTGFNKDYRSKKYGGQILFPTKIYGKQTGQEDINLEIRKRKFRWIGHTLRKGDREIPKAALHWNPQGNRKRGRPKNSWRISVIKEAGRSWNELRFLAADRQKWKRLIDNLWS